MASIFTGCWRGKFWYGSRVAITKHTPHSKTKVDCFKKKKQKVDEEGITTTWYRDGVWNINGMYMLKPHLLSDPDRYAISDYQYHMLITAKHTFFCFGKSLGPGCE